MRDQLISLLRVCHECASEFYGNAALIADEKGDLDDEQVDAVLTHLLSLHQTHVH